MAFNFALFKDRLLTFGTLNYALIYRQGLADERIEFVVDNLDYLYAMTHVGDFCETEILPYYPNLITLSFDKVRLKGVFRK